MGLTQADLLNTLGSAFLLSRERVRMGSWWWCAWWRVIRCGVGSSESACGGGGRQWDRARMRQTLIHIPGHSVATGGQRHIHPPADWLLLHTTHWTQQVALLMHKIQLQTTEHSAHWVCTISRKSVHKMPAYLPLKHPLNSKQQMANISTHANTAPKVSSAHEWAWLRRRADLMFAQVGWLTVSCRLLTYSWRAYLRDAQPSLPPCFACTLIWRC